MTATPGVAGRRGAGPNFIGRPQSPRSALAALAFVGMLGYYNLLGFQF